MPIVPLGEICEMDRQALRTDDPLASGLPFVGVEHVESGSGAFNFDNGSRVGSQKSSTFRFDERHVLYSKLRPYLNKVATPDFVGRCSTELVPLLPKDSVDREFMACLLRRSETVEHVMSSVTGSRMPRTDMNELMSLSVPLPPHDEQLRIVRILNRAARVERLRTRAQDLLEEFIPALFVRMFGDPVENPMGWDKYSFLELVSDGTRKCVKVQKRDYRTCGLVQIIDQGKPQVGGYSDQTEGAFHGPFPTVVFGDHTRRFKLIEEPFFLGADGVKLLEPKTGMLDPVFLFGQCHALNIKDAGYSRHFRFLKMTDLCLPPFDLQTRYRNVVNVARAARSVAVSASRVVSALNASLMDRLLDVCE